MGTGAGTLSLGGDLTVDRIGFGAMRITGRGIWGPPSDPEGAVAVLRRAVELGVTLIDTADSYGPHVSEELIAEALHPYPSGLVIATKAGLRRSGPDQWETDARPERLRAACEGSLRRLRLERIDLLQLHRPDPRVPLAESMGALADLQREGKVRHLGICNVEASELAEARAVALVVSVQNRFSAVRRGNEAVIAECERGGLVFLAWAPLDSGAAARSGGVAGRIAAAHGVEPAQVQLAWLLHRSPVIVPIPGTASDEHLASNVAAGSLRLSESELARLDSAGPPLRVRLRDLAWRLRHS
jgi:pyridoxine 4-dehydrogenase